MIQNQEEALIIIFESIDKDKELNNDEKNKAKEIINNIWKKICEKRIENDDFRSNRSIKNYN